MTTQELMVLRDYFHTQCTNARAMVVTHRGALALRVVVTVEEGGSVVKESYTLTEQPTDPHYQAWLENAGLDQAA